MLIDPVGSSGSPGKKAVGLAFNYAAGEEKNLAEASRVLKHTSTVGAEQPSSERVNKDKVEINPSNMDYVESAVLKNKPGSPTKPAAATGWTWCVFHSFPEVRSNVVVLGGNASASLGMSGQRGHKRDRPLASGSGSGSDDSSSLEESVEEHKQPQTEEIMNAELLARVSLG